MKSSDRVPVPLRIVLAALVVFGLLAVLADGPRVRPDSAPAAVALTEHLLRCFRSLSYERAFPHLTTRQRTGRTAAEYAASERATSQAFLNLGGLADSFHVLADEARVTPGRCEVPVLMRLQSLSGSSPGLRVRRFEFHYLLEDGAWHLDEVVPVRG